MTEPESISLAEFRKRIDAQAVPQLHVAFKCPRCNTVQSMADFKAAGFAIDEANRKIGFSCIGRHTYEPNFGCDWTLGGLFRLHKLEVIDAGEHRHPHFEVASPDEAREHMNKHVGTSIPALADIYVTAHDEYTAIHNGPKAESHADWHGSLMRLERAHDALVAAVRLARTPEAGAANAK